MTNVGRLLSSTLSSFVGFKNGMGDAHVIKDVGRLFLSSEVDDDVSSHIVITIKIAKSEINYRSLPPSSGVVLTRLFGQRAELLQSGTGKSSQSRRKQGEQPSSLITDGSVFLPTANSRNWVVIW
jgi:hypothetical protein